MKEQIFHRLYDEYHQDVFQFLIYLVQDRQVAEDLSHEVYIRAIKSYETFRNDASEKTWLFAIAKNVSIDHFRKQNVRAKHATDYFDWEKSHLTAVDKLPVEQLELNEQMAELLNALNDCTGDQKIVIILRYIQELSIQETAAILMWTEAKVKTTQHRAIRRLKQILLNNKKGDNEYV